MLENIHIHNFKCISDLTIDLSYKEKAPVGYKKSTELYFYELKIKNRGSPVFAMYGANGSGKSTIIKAIQCFKKIIVKGIEKKYYVPNRIIDNDSSLTYTEVSIAFWKESNKFEYSIKFNEDTIIEEALTSNRKEIFCIKDSELLNVISNDIDARNEFSKRCINAKSHKQIKTFLYTIPDLLPGINKVLIDAKEYILKDLCIYNSNNEQCYISGINNLASTYSGTHEEKQKAAINCIVDYLGRLDSGIVGLTVNKTLMHDRIRQLKNNADYANFLSQKLVFEKGTEDQNVYIYDAYTLHKTINGNIVNFGINSESDGTKILIGLLGEFLTAIRTGKVILIDELDESLHSLLVKELVNLFKTKRINENGAQIIFTAHNPEILDILNPNGVGIVNYRKSKGSVVTKISEFGIKVKKGSLRDSYLKGTFGGIPFPYV